MPGAASPSESATSSTAAARSSSVQPRLRRIARNFGSAKTLGLLPGCAISCANYRASHCPKTATRRGATISTGCNTRQDERLVQSWRRTTCANSLRVRRYRRAITTSSRTTLASRRASAMRCFAAVAGRWRQQEYEPSGCQPWQVSMESLVGSGRYFITTGRPGDAGRLISVEDCTEPACLADRL